MRPLVTDAGGIPHSTDSGEGTRYAPAREALRLRGADTGRVRPVGSEAPRPASRSTLHEALPRIRKESPA
ncbi:hypothetical protein ACFYO2_23255 [Streptomyces sp. NPDC006602]|uniref:hypothetical protein n=1 Tax=Streptomyces sp. NPDC006602 TaxID=3364751 RepID=UPI0036851F08